MTSLRRYATLLRRNRNFRLLWLAQLVSETGDWLYTLALYSLLLEFTGRAGTVATALVLQLLPQFFLSPLAGVINDRLSRVRVMIVTDLVRCAVVGAMLLAATPEGVPWLYVLLALETAAWAFFEPGRSALLRSLVEEEDVVTANALASITWSVTLTLGAALGGFIGVWLGRHSVFLLNAASFLLSAWLLGRIRVTEPHLEHQAPLRVADLFALRDVREGMAYVQSDSRLLAMLLVKAGLGLTGAHWILATIYGERLFPVLAAGGGAEAGLLGMSILTASRGVGAIVGPLIATAMAGQSQPRLRTGITIGYLLLSLGYLLLSRAPTLPLAAASLFLANSGSSVVWVFSSTLLQLNSEDRFRGRLFSADFACFVLMLSITSIACASLMDRGTSPRVVAASVSAVALLPALAWVAAQGLWHSRQSS